MYLLPDIIAGVRALFCLSDNKFLSLLGSVLVLVGVGIFFVLLRDSDAAALTDFLNINVFWDSFGVTIGDSFSGFNKEVKENHNTYSFWSNSIR